MYANTGIIPNENTSISVRSHDGIVIVELSAGSVSMSIHLDSLDVCDRLLSALTEAREHFVAVASECVHGVNVSHGFPCIDCNIAWTKSLTTHADPHIPTPNEAGALRDLEDDELDSLADAGPLTPQEERLMGYVREEIAAAVEADRGMAAIKTEQK